MKILNEIQQKLKASKGQFNSFGGYKYRSCEDILEAVKPLLGEAVLTISDEMVMLGDRYYIKATATISVPVDEKTHLKHDVSAYAREPLSKKGMDEAQITGATSSYARKYALNGLFCIDDAKDADSTNKHGKEKKATEKKSEPTDPFPYLIKELGKSKIVLTKEELKEMLNPMGFKTDSAILSAGSPKIISIIKSKLKGDA